MSEPDRLVVAIDGPAGAGKSTVARAVAERLGVAHLDTGAMYRALAFAVLANGLDPDDAGVVRATAESAEIVVEPDRVTVDGVDATFAIRGPEVTVAVSAVARHPEVRAVLVGLQRGWVAARGRAVAEGRDIGAVVLPDADLKIWLTASPRVRAERRHAETGDRRGVAEIAADIERRDLADTAQMLRADDAVVIDTSTATVAEVVDEIVGRVEADR